MCTANNTIQTIKNKTHIKEHHTKYTLHSLHVGSIQRFRSVITWLISLQPCFKYAMLVACWYESKIVFTNGCISSCTRVHTEKGSLYTVSKNSQNSIELFILTKTRMSPLCTFIALYVPIKEDIYLIILTCQYSSGYCHLSSSSHMPASLAETWSPVCCILFGTAHKLPSLLKCCLYKSMVDILPDGQPESLKRKQALERDRDRKRRREDWYCSVGSFSKNCRMKDTVAGTFHSNIRLQALFHKGNTSHDCFKSIWCETIRGQQMGNINKRQPAFISTPKHSNYIRPYLYRFTGEPLSIAKTAVWSTSVMFAQLCPVAVSQDIITLTEA